MNSLIRVCCISSRVRPARPDECLKYILSAIETARESAPDVIVLPAFALTSASCGSLFGNIALLDAAKSALDDLCLATADLPCYLVAGLVIDDWGKPAPVCAVLRCGEILGFVPADPGDAIRFDGIYSDRVLPAGTVFGVGNCRFTVLSCAPDQLPLRTAELLRTGCDLVVCPTCAPVYAGYISDARRALKLVSKSLGCAIALCNGGTGESTHPRLYTGFAGIYECGEEMRFISHKNIDRDLPADLVTADVDVDIIASQKHGGVYLKPFALAEVCDGKKGILRRIPQNPFLTCSNRDAYIGELYNLQIAALMGRMQNLGIQRVVLGISGGLDSTLALLVAAMTVDCLGLPRENVLAVTMPGFGTTGRTHQNARALMAALGCSTREVPIRDVCEQHFADIGQDPQVHDVTYENAQARERTQILLDLANQAGGGLVLGTGDLSEAALGWCTFGGDHLAHYNINVCLTKNLIRAAVKYIATTRPDLAVEAPGVPNLAATLTDILDTPVSPELLPAGKDGQIVQRTEDILGKYDLHDFFTYYFVRYGFRPSKLFRYACMAFGAQAEPAAIKESLLLFLRRFISAQFKRSCAPDAAAITEVHLLGHACFLPSDADARALLAEVEQLTL